MQQLHLGEGPAVRARAERRGDQPQRRWTSRSTAGASSRCRAFTRRYSGRRRATRSERRLSRVASRRACHRHRGRAGFVCRSPGGAGPRRSNDSTGPQVGSGERLFVCGCSCDRACGTVARAVAGSATAATASGACSADTFFARYRPTIDRRCLRRRCEDSRNLCLRLRHGGQTTWHPGIEVPQDRTRFWVAPQ